MLYVLLRKQTKRNLQKYFHPSSLKQLTVYMRTPAEVPILKKTKGLCPSRSYYCICTVFTYLPSSCTRGLSRVLKGRTRRPGT